MNVLNFIKRIKNRDNKSIYRTIFYSENSFPDDGQVLKWVIDLKGGKKDKRISRGYVDRGEEHAISWIINFLKTENRILSRDFSSESGKGYELSVLSSLDMSEIIFKFKLKTIGIDGGTSYSVGIKKYFDDSGDVGYICIE